jgi:mRNA interferase MazF
VKRGDIITVAAPGDDGKPRPAVIIQSDSLDAADSVLVALLTSTQTDAPLYRLTLTPTTTNGLKSVSQIMADKILAYPRQKCGPVLGHLSATEIIGVNTMLSVMIGLAD